MSSYCGRCFRSVEFSSDGYPQFIASDAEAQPQSGPRCWLGATHRATHETLDPGAHIAGLAFALLRLRWAHRRLRGSHMARVGAPASGREAGERTRRYALWPWETPRLLASPTALRPHGPPVLITGLPYPPRLPLRADLPPPLIAFGGQPSALLQLLGAPALPLHLLWGQGLPCRLLDRWDGGRLLVRSCRTVGGLTGNTRAVSRMPRACIARSTSWCLTSGQRPA